MNAFEIERREHILEIFEEAQDYGRKRYVVGTVLPPELVFARTPSLEPLQKYRRPFKPPTIRVLPTNVCPKCRRQYGGGADSLTLGHRLAAKFCCR